MLTGQNCAALLSNSNIYVLYFWRGATWLRVTVWLALGVIIYVFYGRTHSSLKHAVHVKDAQVDNTTSLLA